MAKRSRHPATPPSEESSSPLSSAAFSDFEETDFTQPTANTASQVSQGRKPRKAAVAAVAKRRAANETEEDEIEYIKATKKVRRGTIVRTTTADLDFELEEEEEEEVEAVIKTKGLDTGSKDKNTEINASNTKSKAKSTAAEGLLKPKAKRKTKKEKEAEKMPIAGRTVSCAFKLGAHVSIAEGVQNSVTNAVKIGANAFALFLKSQRKWESPPYKPENIIAFRKLAKDIGYDSRRHMLPHGSYLVNLAQKDKEKAAKAYESFLDDLKRAESLNIGLFNFHPGSTLGEPRKEALQRIAEALNRAHKETKFVKTVLETMAGQGNVIGCKFEDLRDIISLVKDKSRIGVCIDTCHSFSAGYDLRSQETYRAVMKEFDDVIGFRYLSALHLNDSKAPFNSHRDLHQNIGLGFLGLSAFRNVMNTKEFHDIPMVLETPLVGDDVSTWAKEIKLLESLIGLEADNPKFLSMEKEYADKGAEERKKVLDNIGKKENEKAEKVAKKKEKETARAEKARLKEEKKAEKERIKAEKAVSKGIKKGAGARRTIVSKDRGESSESELSELSDHPSEPESDASSCGSKND
ncbi:hypothetical protein ABW19_dt0208568 [Dactylella cylindrospora]|nr:hypothetical protein ABW19_dt0208568 [Dactylella cylindrospora]